MNKNTESEHETFLHAGHFFEMRPARGLNPPFEEILVDEVGQEGSDGGTVGQSHEPQKDNHYRMDFLELVAVGEDFVD